VDFIRENKDRTDGGLRWGVEPICTVLTEYGVKIALSTNSRMVWSNTLGE
jgi:putative transposase